MGFLDGLLGSPGGVDQGWKDHWNSLWEQMNGLDYNPQMDTAQTMEDYDRLMGNTAASGMAALGGSGFSGSPMLAGTRSRFGATAARDARQRFNDWKMKKLMGMSGLLGQGLPAATKQPTQGLAGAIGGMAGLFGGGGKPKLISDAVPQADQYPSLGRKTIDFTDMGPLGSGRKW